MRVALSGHSALSALRALRSEGCDLGQFPRVDLLSPDPAPAKRWTRRAFGEQVLAFSHNGTLELAVPEARQRIRTKGVSCTVYSEGLPGNSYIDTGRGYLLPCPELLFVEMGNGLSPIAQTLLGMELCGTYSRPAAYQLAPATTTAKIRDFIRTLWHVNGVRQARGASARLIDNAWSPMEAIIAALISLPLYEMGYGLRKLQLNPRLNNDENATRRIPDILVAGTKVGLNYEGEAHLDLGGIVRAATEATLSPKSASSQKVLDKAVGRVRDKYVDDRRRDRELWEAGLTVFTVTKEDLYAKGAFDSLMLSVYSAIERDTCRDLNRHREFILDKRFRHERQLRIWSLLPGKTGDEARRELLAEFPNEAPYFDYLIDETAPIAYVETDSGSLAF